MPALNRRNFVGLCAATSFAAIPSPLLAADDHPAVAFASDGTAPRLGQGSWHMADGRNTPEAAQDAMRLGISLGLTLIDTADDYSQGRSEDLIADVIAGQRDKLFLVSKLMPAEATKDGVQRALDASLKRLKTDHLDLYLLHFREKADLSAAVKGFEHVRDHGLIKRWGVSNFSVKDMEELISIPGGEHCATNQVLYNLAARGIEADLAPWCRKRKMPIMAYSPLGAGGKGAILSNETLKTLAGRRGVSPAAIALAWAMRDGQTIVVSETDSVKHVRENAAALGLVLSDAEIKALDEAFPPPHAG